VFDLARTPGHYRAISHSTQESSTATEEQQSLQLSGRDGCAPYTFQAGYAAAHQPGTLLAADVSGDDDINWVRVPLPPHGQMSHVPTAGSA
jgi:hypothetical protein